MTVFTVGVVAAFPLALIPPVPEGAGVRMALAAVLFASTAAAIVLVPWHRLPEPARLIMVLTFCLGVHLLREAGGGGSAGYTPLLLIPVIWQALYGRRIDLAITIAAATATVVLPIVLIGGEAYPVRGWRSAVLSAMTWTVAATTVQGLITRIRRHEQMLASVIELTRGMSDTDDVKARVCDGIRDIAEADVALISEIDATGRLRVSTASGVALPRTVDAPPEWQELAAGDGTQVFVQDAPPNDITTARSVLHQPIRRDDAVVALMSVGWSHLRRTPPTSARQAIELVSAEATVAAERHTLMEQVTRLARYDELTGLANRRTWDEHLAMEISRADRTDTCLVVGLLDLDHFKRFNDQHGHLAGDRLLKAASAAWSSTLRPTDMLARWGGEEFALALPNTDLPGAHLLVERLRALTPMDQSFSAGLTEVNSRDAMTVMQSADSALYLAKESGRDRVVAFDHTGREQQLMTPTRA